MIYVEILNYNVDVYGGILEYDIYQIIENFVKGYGKKKYYVGVKYYN